MHKSYKMRMYKRRLWQQRTQIILTGLTLWNGIAAIIILVTEVAQ